MDSLGMSGPNLLGLCCGAVVGRAGPISLALVALPWAIVPAGAGVLVGSGSLWLPHLVLVADRAGGMPADAGSFTLAGLPVALFAVGLAGTLVARRRARAG